MRSIFIAGIIVISAFAFVSPARASETEAKLRALLTKADEGNGDAKEMIGAMFRDGSLKAIQEQAKGGNAATEYLMGRVFEMGRIDTDEDQGKVALMWFQKAAEQKLAFAEYKVGQCFRYGWGTSKDVSEASKWFKKSIAGLQKLAENGDVDAQYTLAQLYDAGPKDERDHAQAEKWYLEAANQGDLNAENDLSILYMNVTKNNAAALDWLQKAADSGSPQAEMRLGLHYMQGDLGLQKNLVEAYYWLKISQLNGILQGMPPLPDILRLTESAENEMPPEQKAETGKRVAEWLKSHRSDTVKN